ncbi:probable methyltransferase-like protein 15 [Betta splendens]|uniref:12S rRNA N(4)-cytidine methyltransferase METTL15 n=1 Tax=Betta splendens TaxID=158456 RepID=A0A6P7M1T1_BETSP|nr:probable methyltransferase-like protein 15 [Betta splendens]
MIFHMCARSNLLLRKEHLAVWRAWRPWKLQHSSGVCASSGPGPQDRSEDLSSVSPEKPLHTPVMLKEVLHFLDIQPGQVVLDMTFGGGGHSKAILNTVPGVTIVALDRDPTAVSLAQQLAEKHHARVKPVLGRFSELEALLSDLNIKPGGIDGVLLDAGCSSMQMDQAERGFSLSKDGPLDMRMDGERYPDMPCAADVVNTLDQQALASILAAYGEERHARKIASAIVEARRVSLITRTQQLASVVAGSFPTAVVHARKDRLHRPAHVATKTFQALRVLVNDELNELHAGLRAARDALRPGGRLCVVTFHSLEDRLVKRFLQGDDLSNLDQYHFSPRKQSARREKLVDEIRIRNPESVSWLPLRRKVIVPDKDDVQENPRGRSAKLRAAVKR